MKKTLILAVLLSLSGCVTDSAAYLPDGTEGHHITCGGAMFSMGDCFQKAGELCGPSGYKIIGSNGEATPYSSAGGGFAASGGNAAGGFSSHSGAIVQRDLFVKCNSAKSVKPQG